MRWWGGGGSEEGAHEEILGNEARKRDRTCLTTIRTLRIYFAVLFVETSGFTKTISEYLDGDQYRTLQNALIENPKVGKAIPDTHGVRKMRWSDARRGRGKRGGSRVIYFHHEARSHIWMLAIYDKDEASDLSASSRKAIGEFVLSISKR